MNNWVNLKCQPEFEMPVERQDWKKRMAELKDRSKVSLYEKDERTSLDSHVTRKTRS